MTKLETTVLNTLYDICLIEQCGIKQLAEETGLTTNVLRGVVSSLQKKGLAKVHDNTACLIIIVEDCEWPCDWFSEEEWEEKRAAALASA